MNILAGMRELAEARAERFEPIRLANFFPLSDLSSMTWIGTFSWANQSMKQRWLKDNVVLEPFGIPQIPPELARDYLRTKYTEYRRHTIPQFKAINEHRAAPLFAKIGHYENMVLVDLSAAYWSILKIVGWDVDYSPGRWIGKRSEMFDFPFPESKLARNSLVSAGLITRQHIWTGERLNSINAHNPLINYDIWSITQDILHSLATIALRAGSPHVHTDGYILPEKNVDAFRSELAHWGLPSTIKASGDCEVKGIGAYSIGEKRTKHAYHFRPHDLNKVYQPDIVFLRPRIAKLARAHFDWSIHEMHNTKHGG